MRPIIISLALVAFLGGPWFLTNYPEESLGAAAILSKSAKSVASIQAKYTQGLDKQQKVRVLLVPGHESGYGGAEYRTADGIIYERDLVVTLSDQLGNFLVNDSRYDVFIARGKDGWHPELQQYFDERWDDIVSWQFASQKEMSRLREIGSVTQPTPAVYHNKAPKNVALRLYGITKWANENDIDIVIHIHVNDDTEHTFSQPGKYSGFSIYVPDRQYNNGTTTRAIARTIFGRLERYNAVSSLPGESIGIIDESELIAIGANDTSDAASMLIEYAYIYEPAMVDPSVRGLLLNELAYGTYLGLQDFFTPAHATIFSRGADTLILPHRWTNIMDGDGDDSYDVFALQTALILDGSYPPPGKSMNDCPRTGALGACTKLALDDFQAKYGIVGEDGIAGTMTIEKLNQLFAARSI